MRSLAVKFKNDTESYSDINSNSVINYQYNIFNDLYNYLQINVDKFTEVHLIYYTFFNKARAFISFILTIAANI